MATTTQTNSPAVSATVGVTRLGTPPPLPGTPHYQGHGAENRVTLLSVNYTYGNKSTAQVVSSSMTAMKDLANVVLRTNNIAMLSGTYAPNEAASLVHNLQNALGI